MKTKLQIFALLACSAFAPESFAAPPDASDVEPLIQEVWGSLCVYNGKPQFKVTNVKKTNGINRGRFYEVLFAYKITLLNDRLDLIANKENGGGCLNLINQVGMITSSDDEFHKIENELHKGVELNGSANMIPSENGWLQVQ